MKVSNPPFHNPQPDPVPQHLEPEKHRLPRLLLVNGALPFPRQAARIPCCGPAARPLFLSRRQVGGDAVRHGYEFDEEEVEARRVQVGGSGVAVGR